MIVKFPIITEETKLLPFYVTSIGTMKNQPPISRKDGYPYYQLAFCTQGKGIFVVSDEEYEISQGMVFFFTPDLIHEYYSIAEPWTVRWITFQGFGIESILTLYRMKSHAVIHLNQPDRFEMLLNQIESVLETNLNNTELRCSVLLYDLIMEYEESLRANNQKYSTKKYEKLDNVLQFIEENYNRSLTLEEMAAVLKITPNFLCSLFKQKYLTTPFRYLMNLRIQKAKHLIFEHPELLIKEVAYKTGFNDISYFCSTFREIEGMSPSAFKKMAAK